MPEFQLDYGGREAYLRFRELDAFTRGYIEAMFFTSTGSADDGDLEDVTVAELAEETWNRIVADCKAFQEENAKVLAFIEERAVVLDYDLERAGREFWFTRRGHGVGYWCSAYDTVGEFRAALDRLDAAVRAGWRSECDLYRGDDGRLYL